MPTYDYRCEKCGQFEAYQSIKDDALTACPTCGSSVKRLISRNVNLLFKGSGFHITDYRNDSYRSAAKSESTSSSTTSSSGTSSSTSTSTSSGTSSTGGSSSSNSSSSSNGSGGSSSSSVA